MNFQQIVKDVQTLDRQDPGAWPLWFRVTCVVLLMIALAGGGYYYFIIPLLDELEQAQAQEPALKTEFETKQKKVAALDALKEQLTEMERSFGAMLRVLPSKAEIANLLIEISQTRLASSLEEELFQPQGESPREFYAEIPNKIIVVGSYHEMGTFVSGVAALPRIVTIEDVEIKPADKGGRGNVRMSATAKTYRYLDENEIAAAKPKPKQAKGRR